MLGSIVVYANENLSIGHAWRWKVPEHHLHRSFPLVLQSRRDTTFTLVLMRWTPPHHILAEHFFVS